MRAIALLLAASVGLPLAAQSPAQPPQGDSAAALAARVQARYAKVQDFEGDFVQSYEGGVLRTRATESGTLAVRQPGRFRFVYTKPERKEFVSDGETIYTYLVADRQVYVSPAPGPNEATTPVLFLAGRADLGRDFAATYTPLPGAPEGLTTLRLVPRKADPDYEWFGIGVDPASLQIRFLVALDRQGGRSAFTFSNLRENRGLADNTFRFRIPRGVDVVNHGPKPQ